MCSTSLGVKGVIASLKPNDMLVSFSWQGYLDFSLFTVGFAEDAHARHSSNKFDFCTRSIASFTFHFNS